MFHHQAAARLLRREHVLCIGDSHVGVMRRVHVPGAWFRERPVGGATASGIHKEDSTTQALPAFLEELRRAKPWHQVLILLGEVDCGYVIWHRAQRLGLSIADQLNETLAAYAGFISRVSAMGFAQVIVLSVPLPTITDYPSQYADVANLRRHVRATQAQRTELTLEFNARLRDRCAALGVTFVDVTTGHLDPGTGLIDRRFLRSADENHHLADQPFSSLIARELRWVAQKRPRSSIGSIGLRGQTE